MFATEFFYFLKNKVKDLFFSWPKPKIKNKTFSGGTRTLKAFGPAKV
jgi:hypothetical protein